VLFRDLRDIVMNLMTLGFFLTPILYTIERIDKRWLRALLRINPMTPFVCRIRTRSSSDASPRFRTRC